MLPTMIRNNRVGISVLPPSRAQLEARAKKCGVPLRWIDPRPRHRWQRLHGLLLVLAAVGACVVLFVLVHRPH